MKVKKLISYFTAWLLILTSVPLYMTHAAAETLTYDDDLLEEGGSTEGWNAYTAYMTKEGRLSNLYNKINSLSTGESLNVVYFGGSITNGSNKTSGSATDADGNAVEALCWRERVGEFITSAVQEKHPDATVENRVIHPIEGGYDTVDAEKIYVNNINAAIGATGSYFGVHRAYDDIGLGLSKKPDLVFLEFAYNDNRGGDSSSRTYTDASGDTVLASAADFESIILNIYQNAPDCEIIGIFTTGTGLMNNITENALSPLSAYPQLSAQRAVMRKYDIPYLYVGKDLVDQIIDESGDESSILALNSSSCTSNSYWMSYFSDQVHPNRHGYKFYADKINTFLSDALEAAETSNPGLISKDYETLLSNTYFDSSVLKLSANEKKMADIYYDDNTDMLSYWQKNADSSAVYTASCYNDSLESVYAGASLAFRFTGTSLGFWRARSATGGTLVANVYTVNDDETLGDLYCTSSVIIGSTSNAGLAERWVVAEAMPEATYEVQVHTEESSFGTSGVLRRVFINGSADSIVPVEHPDIPVEIVYDDIELLPLYVSPNEKYNLSITQNTEDDGYQFAYSIDDSTTTNIRSIKWDVGGSVNIITYPYLILEYKIDSDASFVPSSIDMVVRSVTGMGSSLKNVTYSSGTLFQGQWMTAVLDLSSYLSETSSLGASESSQWKRLEFYPFGANVTRSTSGIEEAKISLRSIRFSHTSTPVVEPDEDGEQVAYVSKSGLVTMGDTGEFEAFTNFSDAFDALGEKGGTIYFQGDHNFSDGTAAHGDVTVIGVGDSDILRAQNKLYVQNVNPDALSAKYGNVEFRNLSLSYENSPNERWIYTVGYTMTIGEKVVILPDTAKSKYYVHAAPFVQTGSTKTSGYVFSSDLATYSKVATMAGYNAKSVTFKGNSNYVFNAGNFGEVFGGARNGATAGIHAGYGDVAFTFNGGTFSNTIYTGSYRNGSRYGNVVFTFNGGTLSRNVSIGSYYSDAGKNPGNVALIVNCKEISQTPSGKIGNALCTFGTETGYGTPTGSIVLILNNAELAESVKAGLDTTSSSTYKIRVTNGKATPVFAPSDTEGNIGSLLGFELTGDDSLTVPYIGDTPIAKNALGYYNIPESENITDITFVNELGIDTYYDVAVDQHHKFTVMGAQIRIKYGSESNEQALRFVGRIGSDVLSSFAALNESNVKPESTEDAEIGYGFVVLPTELLSGELTKTTDRAAIVPAVKLFEETAEYTEYTVCITNIDVAHYKRKYMVRPYITYSNSIGEQKTVYGESYETDIYSVAEAVIANTADETVKNTLQTDILDAYDNYQ